MSQKFEQGCVDPSSTTTAATALDNALLGMSGFRVEPPHVAQQSRRDKLRVQPIPAVTIPDNLLVPHRGAAPDLVQVRDVYDAALFSSSAMLDFSAQEASSFANPSTSAFHDGSNGVYKSPGSQPSCDWITSCVGGGGVAPIQSPFYPYHLYQLKPGISGYHNVRSRELSGQENQKQFGDSHFSSPPFCHNALQEVVASCSPTVAHQGMETASLVQQNIRDAPQPWVDAGSELLLLPSYGNQANTPRLESTAVWLNRQPQQWKGDEGLGATTQGLSLSLSSNPLPELQVAQFEERFGHEDFAARADIIQGLQSSQVNDAGISGSHLKFTGNRGHGNTIQSVGGSSMDGRRGTGPLGPFTGYATILKSSKFLRPAQQLLDEFCSLVTGSKLVKQCGVPERSSGVVTAICDAADPQAAENGFGQRGGNSGASSSSFYSSTEACGKGDVSNGASQIHRPEFQQMKAKLLYMQEEVCRRYKQYHQQMQMVVSSFESVAGLSAATPYTSLALKAVSKHFRSLKNAISDQLRHISKVLGEEFMLSPGSSRDTMTTLRLKFMDQSLRRQKTGDTSSSFQDHTQPVWRPQRGLPERAVAVLRAWLFEHFLHPYPTDTDKHMLASQTGLSRNQVSNWFINARVRLWKPMVEEIHMLETKGLTEMDLNSASRNDTKPCNPPNGGGLRSSDQRSEGQCSKPSDCSSMGSVPNDESHHRTNIEQWHREKRSRMDECMVPESMGGGLMSFAAYQGGVDIGGLGAVSLTLGLRHNEGANVAHQQQQMRHFAGQMVHDFVG